MKIYSFIIACLLLVFVVSCTNAQSPTQLRKKCPNTSIYSDISITSLGDITVNPCPSRTTTFTQNVSFPSGTVITASGLVGNPNLTFTAAGSITSTSTGAQLFRAQTYDFQNATATSEFKLSMLAGVSNGSASFGDCVTTPTACVQLSQASNASYVSANQVEIGNVVGAGNGRKFAVNDTTGTFVFSSTANDASIDFGGSQNNKLQRTITAGGTTGAQIINKPAGTVNFAAAATSLVVTNSTVTANSIISVMARTNDATCAVKNYVATGGSFTINMTAACTAETSVGFIVWN